MAIVIDGRPLRELRRIGEARSGRVNHQRITADGIEFDSKSEHDRYLELRVMERAGVISDLECHPRWEIIPKQAVEGHRPFLAAHYTADFAYTRDGVRHVEDVKSTYTREAQDYILRRKLMYLVHGIYVEEVIR